MKRSKKREMMHDEFFNGEEEVDNIPAEKNVGHLERFASGISREFLFPNEKGYIPGKEEHHGA